MKFFVHVFARRKYDHSEIKGFNSLYEYASVHLKLKGLVIYCVEETISAFGFISIGILLRAEKRQARRKFYKSS